eukprot:g33730.t1
MLEVVEMAAIDPLDVDAGGNVNEDKRDPIAVAGGKRGTISNDDDTSVAVSVIAEPGFNKICSGLRALSLPKTLVRPRPYTGEPLQIKGMTSVLVLYEKQLVQLPLI